MSPAGRPAVTFSMLLSYYQPSNLGSQIVCILRNFSVEDNMDDFESIEDAYDAFEDDEDAWDDY